MTARKRHYSTHSLSPLPHARLATANPTHTHTCTDRWNDRHTRIRRCPAPAGQILKLSLPPNAISNSKRLDKECLLRLELGEGVNQNSISSLAFSFSLTSAAAAPPSFAIPATEIALLSGDWRSCRGGDQTRLHERSLEKRRATHLNLARCKLKLQYPLSFNW